MTSPSASPAAPATKKSFFTEFPLLALRDRRSTPSPALTGGPAKRIVSPVLRGSTQPTHSDGGRPPTRTRSMFRTSTCGLVLAVGEHGEQAANPHTAVDGFEASVDLRVGGPCRDGDVHRRALDRPRL